LGEWNGDALEPFEVISEREKKRKRERSVKKILLGIRKVSC